jgi:hypothetical protein
MQRWITNLVKIQFEDPAMLPVETCEPKDQPSLFEELAVLSSE